MEISYSSEAEAAADGLRTKLQRDLNCLADPDRATRRKGLQRLKGSLLDKATGKPLESQTPEALACFFDQNLRPALLTLFSDAVEFCRETALQLVHLFASSLPVDVAGLAKGAIPAIGTRIGVTPLQEPTEEIRLLMVKLLTLLLKQAAVHAVVQDEEVEQACGTILIKSLQDSFPEVKRECSNSVRALVALSPNTARVHGDGLTRQLVANLGHQHSKTRQITLQGLGQLLVCVADPAPGTSATTYATTMPKLMQETVLPPLQRAVHDRSPQVRHTLARMLSFLLRSRPDKTAGLLPYEPTILIALTSLACDPTTEVSSVAHDGLTAASEHWVSRNAVTDRISMSMGSSLSAAAGPLPPAPLTNGTDPTPPPEGPGAGAKGSEAVRMYMSHNVPVILPRMLETTTHWTVTERCRALTALAAVVRICDPGSDAGHAMQVDGDGATASSSASAVENYLPQLLESLATCLRDDDADVLKAAEDLAAVLGETTTCPLLLDLIIPRIKGCGEGMDTVQSRESGLLILASALRDLAEDEDEEGDGQEQGGAGSSRPMRDVVAAAAGRLAEALAEPGLLLLEDVGLAEAHVAAIGALVDACPAACAGEAGPSATAHLLRAVAQIQGNCDMSAFQNTEVDIAGDAQAVVDQLAEVAGLSALRLLSTHMDAVLDMILRTPAMTGAPAPEEASIAEGKAIWQGLCPPVRGFDGLVRRLSASSGAIAVGQYNPRAELDDEALAAAKMDARGVAGPHLQRLVPVIVAHCYDKAPPDLSLAMLVLLETLLTAPGNEQYWPALTPNLVRKAVVGNMVWKVGRVASTVRKISVACFYSLLHNGYADLNCLYEVAPSCLPILKTNLDDYDASTRQLVCLCLALLFEALPGALSSEPVHELYPSLLKRLDDSSDDVRYAICRTLKGFLGAAPPDAFSGTTMDYTLDQLLLHLDDSDPVMQDLVFKVLTAALTVDKARVAKKAAGVRSAHRSPKFIDELVRLAAET